ncbi:MAG TPA: hypothetical protein VFZ21_25965 [Gemmatimonadaceae bacterium]|nr:hypothetical protein [Gemmatimonadaceae bacterium]
MTEFIAQLLWVAIGEYHAKRYPEYPNWELLLWQRSLREVWS